MPACIPIFIGFAVRRRSALTVICASGGSRSTATSAVMILAVLAGESASCMCRPVMTAPVLASTRMKASGGGVPVGVRGPGPRRRDEARDQEGEGEERLLLAGRAPRRAGAARRTHCGERLGGGADPAGIAVGRLVIRGRNGGGSGDRRRARMGPWDASPLGSPPSTSRPRSPSTPRPRR